METTEKGRYGGIQWKKCTVRKIVLQKQELEEMKQKLREELDKKLS
ncbi:MAG: hypothetical protein ACLTNI_06230 [Lachnospiraceae bacterium]